MARSIRTFATTVLLAALGAAGCTVHKTQDAPALTGPSETGTALSVTVSPDVIFQDGASQSLVTIQAFGPNGQPLRSLSVRAEIVVDGASTDFGSLSARNLVTDSNGRATVVYTAPPAPVFAVDTGIIVDIAVTPLGNDFQNANPKLASIRLVPPGVLGPPTSPFRPDFVAPAATVGNSAVFQATVVDASGADATSQVASYAWSFGDGSTGSGRTATHTYTNPGSFAVTLAITDTLGRSARTTRTVTVAQGQLPTASFLASPSSPSIGQTVNFNASGSSAEPGHQITDYAWNFGDGSTGSGQFPTHAYDQAGSYTVTLKVTDDVGRKSAVASQTISVGTGGPTAAFIFSPSAPGVNQSISFDASASRATAGRTITSYAWVFDDGGTGSGVQTSHTYNAPRTYKVVLTVTDSAGQTASVSQDVAVSAGNPTASFTVSPSGAKVGQLVFFDGRSSTAAPGATIVSYSWSFGDGTVDFNAATSHDYKAAGTYVVRLTVTDNLGRTGTITASVAITP